MGLKMTIGLFVVAYFLRLYAMKFMTKKQPRGKLYHEYSYPVLLTSYSIVYIGGFIEYFFHTRTYSFMVNIFGVIIMFIGLGLTSWSINSVGSSWSQHIEIKKKHVYCQTGPYKYFRYPYYVGVFFELFGACLLFNAWYILWFFFIVHMPLMIYRAGLEEQIMHKFFPPKP
jgi:isoprenylcysteine carboxyl methyltransferase (ICMT) family protein YpbQ